MISSETGFSYTNRPPTEARFMLKLTKNKLEDDELGVFGAEKYFKGVIDEERLKTSNINGFHYNRSIQPQEKHEEPETKPKTPSSVRSESSWNSRKGLLAVSNCSSHSKKTSTTVKSLLANLGCNCCDKGSVKVTEVKEPVKGGNLGGQKTKPLSTRWADDHKADVDTKREDCFTFPVMDDILKSSANGPQNDTGSDASSDLFEIESFSTSNENNSFLARQVTDDNLFLASQVTDNNGYAPSEVSVDWSVVTAGMADLSTPEDLVVLSRNIVQGSGILSGCKSLRQVRISGDEHGRTGGEKATVIVSAPVKKEWWLDSATPVAKIQVGNKLKGAAGSTDSHRRQNRSSRHSQHVAMQQANNGR